MRGNSMGNGNSWGNGPGGGQNYGGWPPEARPVTHWDLVEGRLPS